MKNFLSKHFKLWWVSIPVIFLFSLFQISSDLGEQGQLDSPFLRQQVYPIARTVNGIMTNLKFRVRGEEPRKQNIVILEADEASLKAFGRWPWHRDLYARIIYYTFKLGAKAMGLDMVLSEKEDRVPDDLLQKLQASHLKPELVEELHALNSDELLAQTIHSFRDKLVLGYATSAPCWPRYDGDNDSVCPVSDPEYTKRIEEKHLDQLALPETISLPWGKIKTTPINYMIEAVSNLPLFNDAAKHAGDFVVSPDPDGYIRRYSLFSIHKNRLYPSLALELARIVQKSEINISLTDDARVKEIFFDNETKDKIPSTPLGYLDLNFHASTMNDQYRTPMSYPTISVFDLVEAFEKHTGKLDQLLKDSIVLFGATALGINDMRAFPFNSNSPGVEGHATALDNILTGDALRSASSIKLGWLPLVLLLVLGVIFAILFSKLEAIPSIAVFGSFLFLVGVIDIQLLFKNNINFPTAFLFGEIFSVFVLVLSIRFILEEKRKKVIRDAFSHYLAPQVIDYVLKDPANLSMGGERREVSVLFTDIRGFTTLSETMEPKILSNFLNEYLTAMTDIIFEYGGTLDKYIGDAVMAFWGAPIFAEDHAFQAANASLKMQKKMAELQIGFKEKYGVQLSMGVGLNSGVVSVGNMGSKKIFDYTVIGDQVNLASRLEGLNRLYGTDVLCSQATLDAIPGPLKNQIHYRKLDSVKVKGKTQAIEIIELSLAPIDSKSYEVFCVAREAFKNRKWDEAHSLFTKSSEFFQAAHGKPDSVCILFIERCEKFKAEPPAENWDGSAEMREK